LVNIEIILTSLDPINLVYNFIALAIIAEFDDFVFSALRNEPMKLLLKETITNQILVISHTSSISCRDDELSTVEDDEGEFRRLRVSYKERSCGNKCAYMQYKCFRTFYLSVYFYFMPFTTIMLSCAIPILASI
jgi:hypothetical protein